MASLSPLPVNSRAWDSVRRVAASRMRAAAGSFYGRPKAFMAGGSFLLAGNSLLSYHTSGKKGSGESRRFLLGFIFPFFVENSDFFSTLLEFRQFFL